MHELSNDKVNASPKSKGRALTMTTDRNHAAAVTLAASATIIEARGQQMKGGNYVQAADQGR